MDTPQKPFEPDHLIRLLHAQYPQRTDVLRALQLCSGGYWENNENIYFLRAKITDQVNRESRVVEKLILADHPERNIILEVVADGRIARIGYVTL